MSIHTLRKCAVAGVLFLTPLLTSCASGTGAQNDASLQSSDSHTGFSGYEIDWSMDQIAEYQVPAHVIGTVTRIEKGKKSVASGMEYSFVDYELSVEQSDVSEISGSIVVRQVDLNLKNVGSKNIRVGDNVLFLGSLPNVIEKGSAHAVADWLIKLNQDDTMDYGDSDDRPKYNDYAKKFKLKKKN
jgi:hypothetical protein